MFSVLLAVNTLSAIVTSLSASITPHDQYSSSIGVLGCKINTTRVAYFPGAVNCNDICVHVTYANSRSLYLLRVDSSDGAYDISYDAWNYLAFGASAVEWPHVGGGVAMDYKTVPAEKCTGLLNGGKLPLSAANGLNYLASCIGGRNWVASHHELYNILDPVCKYGYDEVCTLDEALQPHCPHQLGIMENLGNLVVENVVYGTGKKEPAR